MLEIRIILRLGAMFLGIPQYMKFINIELSLQSCHSDHLGKFNRCSHVRQVGRRIVVVIIVHRRCPLSGTAPWNVVNAQWNW